MGKLDCSALRYLTKEDFRVLRAVEMGMKNHELVPSALVAAIAGLHYGGVNKILRQLTKHKLASYDRGKRYDGYRLTNGGYDYLALNALATRGIISSFGNQMGVGKESNIYIVADTDGQEYCLKLHRLGRVCFRSLKEKRDYHGHRHKAGWLYLSRISATKEYAFLKVLHDREFPVPKPIDLNRHCIIMQLVSGQLLNHVREVSDVEELYDTLMNLVLKFANCGVIHGDFNEFNIILRETDETPIIIDFPQMVSINHPNAQQLFERDVNCIREFFKRRFAFESDVYPQFEDIIREDDIDVHVAASGFMKDIPSEDLSETLEDVDSPTNNPDEDLLESLKDEPRSTSNLEHRMETLNLQKTNEKIELKDQQDQHQSSNDSNSKDDFLADSQSDIGSSITTTASTIAPSLIHSRVKKSLLKRESAISRRRCIAKGEASTVGRARKENRYLIKECPIWDI